MPVPPAERRRRPGARSGERGSEQGSEPASQLGPGPAMRARDVATPTDADLSAAEVNLVVVRRHWKPTD